MGIGYPDGQRVQNWDGPLAYGLINQRVPAQVQSPILDVSRYAGIEGLMWCGIAPTLLSLQWYGDPQGNLVLGNRQIVLDPNIQNNGQYLLANMGPFLQVSVQGIGAGNPSVYLTVTPTNRQRSVEFLPQYPSLINLTNQPIGANATLNFYPEEYFAGPVQLDVGLSQTCIVGLQNESATGVWNYLWSPSLSGSGDKQFSLVVPVGAWRWSVTNQAASAGTVTLRVWQSVTGSS